MVLKTKDCPSNKVKNQLKQKDINIYRGVYISKPLYPDIVCAQYKLLPLNRKTFSHLQGKSQFNRRLAFKGRLLIMYKSFKEKNRKHIEKINALAV